MILILLTVWLVVGCVIAWAIGSSSDLGQTSDEQLEAPLGHQPDYTAVRELHHAG